MVRVRANKLCDKIYGIQVLVRAPVHATLCICNSEGNTDLVMVGMCVINVLKFEFEI